jgi:glutamate transport system substrate-binding protein
MRYTRTKALLAGLMLAAAGACGNAGSEDEGGADVDVKKDAASSFKDGTQMKTLADQGTINVGVKFDQPGLGFKGAADKVPSGFDVEMAKVLVAGLGIDPDSDKVKWVETVSDSREPFLQGNKVDLVLASYSITDERRQVVGQAGPYLTTGQQVLVKEDSDVKGTADL